MYGISGLIVYLMAFSLTSEMAKRKAFQQVYNMANIDALTGISNRRRFFKLGMEAFDKGDDLAY